LKGYLTTLTPPVREAFLDILRRTIACFETHKDVALPSDVSTEVLQWVKYLFAELFIAVPASASTQKADLPPTGDANKSPKRKCASEVRGFQLPRLEKEHFFSAGESSVSSLQSDREEEPTPKRCRNTLTSETGTSEAAVRTEVLLATKDEQSHGPSNAFGSASSEDSLSAAEDSLACFLATSDPLEPSPNPGEWLYREEEKDGSPTPKEKEMGLESVPHSMGLISAPEEEEQSALRTCFESSHETLISFGDAGGDCGQFPSWVMDGGLAEIAEGLTTGSEAVVGDNDRSEDTSPLGHDYSLDYDNYQQSSEVPVTTEPADSLTRRNESEPAQDSVTFPRQSSKQSPGNPDPSGLQPTRSKVASPPRKRAMQGSTQGSHPRWSKASQKGQNSGGQPYAKKVSFPFAGRSYTRSFFSLEEREGNAVDVGGTTGIPV